MPFTTRTPLTCSPDHPDGARRRPTTRRSRRARAFAVPVVPVVPVVLVVLVVLVTLLLSGCGLRLETPAPTVPPAGAAERARAGTVADALALRSLADAARAGADPGVATVLTRTADAATAHATELGGVYVSGLGDPTPTTTTSTPARHDSRAVVDLLVAAASRSRTSAVSVTAGDLARLLASITLSRLQDARSLAVAAGLPDGDPVVPASSESTPPTGVPAGVSLSGAEVAQIVLTEDEAGFAEEVAAAWLDGTARTDVLARAESHRERAQEWAVHASIDATGADPRRVAYALPTGLHDAATAGALVGTVETALTTAYLTAIASVGPTTTPGSTTAPVSPTTSSPGPVTTSAPGGTGATPSSPTVAGGRDALIGLADDAWATASSWGATATALPGFGTSAPIG